MKKKLILSILVLCMIIGLSCMAAQAATYSGSCGENVVWTLDDETGVLEISGNGDMPDFGWTDEVPWFDYRASVKSIIVNDGVTSIGDYAFSYCNNAESATIPDGITKIGSDAFSGCERLSSIIIPDSVTIIDFWAFKGCKSLESVTIPDKVTKIEGAAFNGCSSLKNVTISDSVISIGGSVFKECTSLESIKIPDSVTFLGSQIFEDCSSLKSATIGNGVSTLYNIFKGCNSLEEVTLPFIGVERGLSGTKESLFGYIFSYSETENSGTTPQYCNMESKYYYYIPETLRKVTITDETIVPYGAFYNCSNLTSVTIGKTTTKIKNNAFYGCTSLEEISLPFIGSQIGESGSEESVFGYIFGNSTSSYAVGTTKQYYKKDGSYRYYYIPETLKKVTITGDTAIPYRAFNNCVKIENVSLAGDIEIIGEYAFEGCTRLKEVTIPESVTDIEQYAFFDCAMLKHAYYEGSEEDWENIFISNSGNGCLTKYATIYYDSVIAEPEIPDTEGVTPEIGYTSLTFTPIRVSEGSIIAALVEKDGVSMAYATTYSGTGTVTFTIEDGFDSIKIMAWESYESMQYLMEYATVE